MTTIVNILTPIFSWVFITILSFIGITIMIGSQMIKHYENKLAIKLMFALGFILTIASYMTYLSIYVYNLN